MVKNSISKKITSFIIIMLIISGVLLGCIGGIFVHIISNSASEKELSLECENEKSFLDNMLESVSQSVNILAGSVLNSINSAETLKYKTLTNIVVDNISSQVINTVSYTSSCIGAYVRFNPELVQDDEPAGIWIQKSTATGTITKLEPTDILNYDEDDTEHVGWYYLPVKAGKAIWLAPYYNKNINIYMISYVVPIYKYGTLLGVVGMDIDFKYITEKVTELKLYETGHAFLLDENDVIIYHPHLNTGDDFSFDSDNIYAVETLSNNMKIVLEVPYGEVYADRNFLIMICIFVVLIILLISIIIALKVCASIVKPLKSLTDKAQRINSGNLNESFEISSDDEVGVLAGVLKKTMLSLKQYIDFTKGMAYFDTLTGVKNKNAYDEYEAQINQTISENKCEPFAIAMCDLNGLKTVNDTCGHNFGNVFIVNCCKLICQVFPNSSVFRVGGDEFTVILKDNDYNNREEELALLKAFIDEYSTKSQPYERLSVACGISEYIPDVDKSVLDVFKRADIRMYENKHAMKYIDR